MAPKRRKVDIVVISDLHLGTFGCHARELHLYLKSIKPGKLILNGDIIDIWQFSKRYWPKSHMLVVKQILNLMTKGTEVFYVTGNHDEMLRKFEGFNMDTFHIVNKMVLRAGGKRIWVFHGDVFDVTMKHSKWLARLGGAGYDLLIMINRAVNLLLVQMGREKISLSKKVKQGVKQAVSFMNGFEQTVAGIAISNGYDAVICGHIHHPEIKTIRNDKGSVVYMNPGDWIENLTALEFSGGEWNIYRYDEDLNAPGIKVPKEEYAKLNNGVIFNDLLTEMRILPS
jgi:UDP-2,3-diacylglucosamine pyrophosphatase LpxH